MQRPRLPTRAHVLALLALTPAALGGCAADVVDAADASVVVDDAAAEVAGVEAAHAPARRSVSVRGRGSAVAGARVASRDAQGKPVDVGFTDSSGVVHLRVATNGLVVAAAPGFGGGARIGAGEISLVPLDATERSVTRTRSGQVVLEVVRAAGTDVGPPRAAGLAAAPAGTSAPAPRFSDVAGHPAAAHIEALASRGVLAGDPNGRFRPNDTLTRAELVTLVLRAAGIDVGPVNQAGFTDVDRRAWYAGAVATARTLGLVRGDPDGRFRPADQVTRAELAAMLARAGSLPQASGAAPTDVAAQHWARGVITSAVAFCRLLDVDAAGAVRADAAATRAEAAVAISRMLGCGADRLIGPGALLARRAADGAWATHRLHHDLRSSTGLGTHYGDASAFHRLSLADKRAYVAARARPGTTPLDPTAMTRSSCIEYAMELAGGGFTAVGQGATWAALDSEARDEGLAGTKLAADLVRTGWRAIYVNADTAWKGRTAPDNEHTFSLAVAQDEQTYYDVPLAGAFLDWEGDEAKEQAMGALSFGVLVLRGGQHVVAIADGAVHELSRGEGPDQHVLYDDAWSAIIDVYANEVHGGGDEGLHKAHAMWTSGVLVVPPGVELNGVVGL